MSHTSVDKVQGVRLEKMLKTAMFRLNLTAEYQVYQPDISRESRPFVRRIS